MVIGYPGRTSRYSSSMETDYQERVSLPITNELRRGQMEIMRRWMDSDPAIWLKYSDTFFGLSNVGEMQEGEAMSEEVEGEWCEPIEIHCNGSHFG